MHIPDGFLEPPVWAGCMVVSAGGLAVAVRRTQDVIQEMTVPLMGVMSAFIFAAQMVNFPVAAGTSGHLLGGMLAAVFLGPWAAALILTMVLLVQCFIFQDGGLTALGANVLNMAFIGTLCGYGVYAVAKRLLSHGMRSHRMVLVAASFCGAWVSVLVAAMACAVEIGLSGTYPFKVTFYTMLGVHSLIGLGEAVITALVVSFVARVRPDLIPGLAGDGM